MKKVCVLKTDGTNCDAEAVYAFQKVGATVDVLTMYHLRRNPQLLNKYDVLALPGGFSYGDDIASGKIFAVELLSFLKKSIETFVAEGKRVIGICNGFQILVRSGLLPFRSLGNPKATLMSNCSGSFECRWVTMHVEKSDCIFTRGFEGCTITLPVAHAEGNFFASKETIQTIEQQNLAVLRYSTISGPTQKYPDNPNNSVNAIAGICDTTGNIFGLMPHPERFIKKEHHPNWRRKKSEPIGLEFFKNAVS